MFQKPLMIVNDGQDITSTTFWESDLAAAGCVYVSWNAGAARVLIPDSLVSAVDEMKAAGSVIISRGRWAAVGRDDALELMFEDGSESPYCLHIVQEQTDRLIPEGGQGSGLWVTVWTREGQQLRLPGKYRKVDMIPCLAPWKEH